MSDITIPDNVYEYCKDRASIIATEWMSDMVSAIQDCNVLSPIEQLFFIEWQYQDRFRWMNELGVVPQGKVEIKKNVYYIDFIVQFDYLWSKVYDYRNKILLPKIAIELDSHIWHEKTPQQVERDKKRERNLIKSGWIVLRYSGREVVRRTEKIVEEARDFCLKEGKKILNKIEEFDKNAEKNY